MRIIMYQVKFENGSVINVSSTEKLRDFMAAISSMKVEEFPAIYQMVGDRKVLFMEDGKTFIEKYGVSRDEIREMVHDFIECELMAEGMEHEVDTSDEEDDEEDYEEEVYCPDASLDDVMDYITLSYEGYLEEAGLV